MTLVFVSYAREDEQFVAQLRSALDDRGIDVWVDRTDIAPSTEWRGEIEHGIESAEALLTVVSPDSAASEMCRHEVERAEQLGKRILPVVHREPGETIPAIAERNWIFWRSDDEAQLAVEHIEAALLVDPDWAKEHTRLLGRALDWERHDRDRHRLLRGSDLESAERALTHERPAGQPQPTPEQREYVRASRVGESRRQRRNVIVASGVAAVAITLAVVALLQFLRANDERERAEEQLRTAQSRALAAQALQLDEFGREETALLLAAEAAHLEPTIEARDALLSLLPAEALVSLRSAERPDAAVATTTSASGRFEVSDDGRVVTDTTTGESQVLVDDPDPFAVFLRDVAISPDETQLVVTNLGANEFQVYDLSDGLPAPLVSSVPPVADETVFGAAFTADGDLLGVSAFSEPGPDGEEEATGLSIVIADQEGSADFDAPVEAALPEDLDLHEALVRVSADDDLGAIVTQWGEAQLFSPRTAQFVGQVLPVECTPDCTADEPEEGARATLAAFDGSTLATIDANADERTFELDIGQWIDLACQAAGRVLDVDEWERFAGAAAEYDPACAG